jgi:hypothetical protein
MEIAQALLVSDSAALKIHIPKTSGERVRAGLGISRAAGVFPSKRRALEAGAASAEKVPLAACRVQTRAQDCIAKKYLQWKALRVKFRYSYSVAHM